MAKERKFARKINSLDSIFDFIKSFINENSIKGSLIFTINFIIEELFTNMVKYSTESSEDILIRLDIDNDSLSTILIDTDVNSYDITETEEVDTTLSLEDRKVGGLGVHLVKTMADDIKYEYNSNKRQSTITVIKHLE